MRRLKPALLLIPVLLAGCEDGPPWRDGGPETEPAARPDFGPTAAYDRLLVFLGPGPDLPTAAVFDFAALSDSVGVRRGTRARLADGRRWTPLMDAGWELDPMRDPWRIVPHGDLRMVVNDAGEIGALTVRGEPTVRLEPGPGLAETSPDAGTQLVLRRAMLAVDGDSVQGVLLDAQLGRPVNPRAARTADLDTPGVGRTGLDETIDTSAAGATPTARTGTQAVLAGTAGYYAVLAPSAGGDLLWTTAGDRSDVRTGVTLEPTAWSEFPEAGTQLPTAWQLGSPDGGVQGELTARLSDRAPVTGGLGPVSALGYSLVTGWVEDRGARRDVYGLVRHIR